MKKIRVSVAMATYNGQKYLEEQIDSILKNLGTDDELVISDDGSKDQTRDIILSYRDKRIRFVEGPKMGVKRNFMNAIQHCYGEYIFLSDQDDVWMENKVEKVLAVFEQEKCDGVVHNNKVFDSDSKEILFDSFFHYRKSGAGIIKNIWKNTYIGCCMAFTQEMKPYILPIPDEIEMHDQWIGLRIQKYGQVKFIDDVLIAYRRHGNNVSEMKHYPFIKMIQNRYFLIKNYLLNGKTMKHYLDAFYYRIRILLNELVKYYKISKLKKNYSAKVIGPKINFVSGSKVWLGVIQEKKYIVKGFDLFKLHLNERNILKKLNVDFFPKVIAENKDYFVEEYFEGISLDQYLLAPQDNDCVKKVLLQMIACLDKLAEYNIIHRDIRPQNILISCLNGEPHLRLIDFGCAIDLSHNNIKFPTRIEKTLGAEYNFRNYSWDDALSFYNILSKFLINQPVFASEMNEIKKRIGRIKYERGLSYAKN